ncbi:MAG TPA: DUF2207 domain-containing protein, partial [Trueperaceae bacterium]
MSLPRLLPLLFALCLGFALAKSYTLESVTQEVYFRADGTVRVEDTRTLRMDGDFSDNTYFVEVDPAPGGSVRFEGARALDGKTPARATINGNEIAWKVHARNETRTFRFSYVLTGEMQVAQDAARFARDVLEPEHAPVGSYRLVLHTPAPSPNQFKVFIFTGRGRIGTLDVAADGSKATVTLPALSADEDVLAVVLLDASVFRVQNVSGSKLGDWLAELGNSTEAFRRASERQLAEAQDASPLWALPAVAIALAVFIWFWRSYRAFGREPPTQDIGPYYREPAEEIPPAVVPFVLTQSPPGTSAAGPAVAATLLDFARRGYLQLQTVTSDGFLGLGNSEKVYYQIVREPKDLPGFEAELWQAFEGAALKADKVSLVGLFQSFRGQDKTPNASSRVFDADDLRDYFKNHPSFAQDWVKEPRDWYERTHGRLLDPDASRRSLPITILAGLLA